MFCFHLIRDNLENLGAVKVHSVVHESFLLLLCLCGVGEKLGSHIWYPSLAWRAAHWSQASAAGSIHRPPSTPLLNHLCAGESQSHKTAVPWMSEVNTDLMTALLRRHKMDFVCREKPWLSSLPYNSQSPKRTFSSPSSRASNGWKKALTGFPRLGQLTRLPPTSTKPLITGRTLPPILLSSLNPGRQPWQFK